MDLKAALPPPAPLALARLKEVMEVVKAKGSDPDALSTEKCIMIFDLFMFKATRGGWKPLHVRWKPWWERKK